MPLRVVLAGTDAGEIPAELDHVAYLRGAVDTLANQNYYHPTWTQLGGHQARCAHLLRDFTDAAQCHPDAHWPEQAQRALRGLIHAWHHAHDTSLAQIPPPDRDPLINEFRHAIRAGLAEVKRIPGPKSSTKQLPGSWKAPSSHGAVPQES